MKTRELSKIAEITLSGIDKKTKTGQKIIKLCNFTDVYYNWDLTNVEQQLFMQASASDKEIQELSLKRGDVCITKDSETRDDIGISCLISDDLSNTVLGYHCALIRPNENIVLGSYLNAFLKTKVARKYFSNQSSGSGQRYTLTKEGIGAVKITFPDLQQQLSILTLFDNICKKIRINNQINDNLSQLAFDTFLYFFASKKANGVVGDLIVEACKSKTQVNDAKGKDGQYPFLTSGEAILRSNNYLVDNRNIFLTTGGNANVKFYVGKADYSTDTWCIRANHEMTDYLYLFFRFISPIMDRKFFQGTGLKHLQKDLLKIEPIYIPSENELERFNSLVEPLYDKISKNLRENYSLTLLRNDLLPLLMNGQVTIR